MLAPDTTADQDSLSPSQFSFASSPHSVQDSEQTAAVDGTSHLRPITRGTTGDSLGQLRPATSRSRAQYYEDSFSVKGGPASSARERVIKDAPIVAELRTNVIVRI